jgi:release factor glutamine methyltransferase
VAEVVRRTTAYLAARGSGSPRLDAELIVAHVLGVERLALYTDGERPLVPAELDAMRPLVARRGRGEPVAQLTGRRAFRRLVIAVTPDVLVPRPETELLVEWALEVVGPGDAVVDWGTGSGAVALALAQEGEGLDVTALERSAAALEVARANGARLGLDVTWLLSDGLAALGGRRVRAVVANPPYLSEAELAAAPPDLGFEPREALLAGPSGLEALEGLAAEAPAHLEPGGWLIAEIGPGQADAAAALWRGAGLVGVEVRRDLAGLPRAVGGAAPG